MVTVTQFETIIQFSMIGVALVIALYAIIVQAVEKLVEKRFSDLKKSIKVRDEAFKSLSNDIDNIELRADYNFAQNRVDELKNTFGLYHYNWGYLVSGIFFSLALILPYWSIFLNGRYMGDFAELTNFSPFFLFVGMLNFVYVWFRTMFDFRKILLGKFDIVEELEKEESEKREHVDAKLK